MAEHVFQNLEDMLPELEDLERHGIFNRGEIRTIVKRRTNFEYKLQRRIVEKDDFLKYLEYELNVDMLRRKRMQRLCIKRKYTPASLGITKRMHYIFQKALKKFGNDIKLWIQYIDFCKYVGSTLSLGRAFSRLTQVHPQNPNVWIMAAKWEFEDNNNIDNARTLLQRALRISPESKILWIEYFRLELLHVDKIKKRQDILRLSTEGDQLENGTIPVEFLANKTSSIVYNNAIAAIPNDIEFRLSFLPVYRLFGDIKENLDEVYNSLIKDFPNNENALHVIAKRPLDHLRASGSEEEELWEEAERESVELYTASIGKQSTGQMWEYYLQAFLELMKDSASHEQAERRFLIILDILTTAEERDIITEHMYFVWCDLLLNLSEAAKAIKILNKALKRFSSVELWLKYLTVKSEHTDNWRNLNAEFFRCFKHIETEVSAHAPVWKLWISTCLEKKYSKANEVFEEALNGPKDVLDFVRLNYINWIYQEEGLKATRKMYKRLKGICTLTEEFVKKAIEIEQIQEIPKVRRLRRLHETAVLEFGHKSIDVWLDFIRFELQHEETATENVGLLYWRAVKTLSNEVTATFVDTYTLLQANKDSKSPR